MDVLEPQSRSVQSEEDERRVENEEFYSTIKGLLERPFLLWYCTLEPQNQPDVRRSKQKDAEMVKGGVHSVPVGGSHFEAAEPKVGRGLTLCNIQDGSFYRFCVAAAADHASELSPTPPGAAGGIQPC